MNRRGFLKGAFVATAAGILVPELVRRTYFLPPRGGWGHIVMASDSGLVYWNGVNWCVKASGDRTGVTDLANLREALQRGGKVSLMNADYFLDIRDWKDV